MPSFVPSTNRHNVQTMVLDDGKVDYFPVETIIRHLRSGRSSFDVDNITLSMIHDDCRRLENHASNLTLEVGYRPKQKDEIYRRLQVYRSFFAPIRRLPGDVLLHIFHLLPVDTVNPNSTPWILGSVCYYWKTLYLSFPTLWSRIVIDTRVGTNLRPQSVSMVHTCLQRSQKSPLAIFMSCGSKSSSISPILFSILDLLLTHTSRWYVVEVDIPHMKYPIFNRLGLLPMLRTIRIALDHEPVDVGRRDSLEHFPKLRDVSITGTPLSSLHLPLSSLTSLETTQTAEDIFRVLPEAKSLEVLTISGTSSFKRLSGSCGLNMLNIPSIRSLHFRCGPVKEIADSLLLDFIEHLTLGSHSSDQPLSSSDIQSVKDLVHRSQCLLRSLSLNFTVCLYSLKAISFNLTRMSIAVESWAACDTFIVLRVKREEDNVVPNLLELHITDVTPKCGGQSFTHEPFGPMIESRWNVPPGARVVRLQRIEIHAKYGWGDLYYSDTVHQMLWRYAEQGLDVIIFDEASTAQ